MRFSSLPTTVFDSPLGWFAIAWLQRRPIELTFGHTDVRHALGALRRVVEPAAEELPYARPLIARLQAYTRGERVTLDDIRLRWDLFMPFQAAVLKACRAIPYGRTLTYRQLAEKAGRPGASRAVGNTMARNPLPILIPCHRVVRSDGGLGGYSAAGGVALKERLLKMEGIDSCQ